MTIEPRRFAVFATSGVLWLVAVFIGLPGLTPGIAVAVLAYVLVGSGVLSVPIRRSGWRLAILWLTLVGACAALAGGTDSGFVLSLFVGLVFGTLFWISWTGTGYMLLHFIGAKATSEDGSAAHLPFNARPVGER